MTKVLGVHAGHEASCALVEDGKLISAIQQERITRRKYDGQECLDNRLPIKEVLMEAGTSLDNIDYIVSSFQAVGPGAVGFQRPLFSEDFNVFDPFDPRHFVVSHHIAHAACAAYSSGFRECAVLVSDSAGSTTIDGDDYLIPFPEFYRSFSGDVRVDPLFTEQTSIYDFSDGALTLVKRTYNTPHNQPDVFVQSEASLYDNMARLTFLKEHCHGQYMAVAGLDSSSAKARIVAEELLDEDEAEDSVPRLTNGWQQRIRPYTNVRDAAPDARVVQEAFERMVVARARQALSLTSRTNISCAGGVFLNLGANTAVANLAGEDHVTVPSAPHDAGISIGCAFIGSSWDDRERSVLPIDHDFYGPNVEYDQSVADLDYRKPSSCHGLAQDVAAALAKGKVIARLSGRAEFGPRALGNRSILCSPSALPDFVSRFNRIKSRQSWRPVSPMVKIEDFSRFFEGPLPSVFMNREHRLSPEGAAVLPELAHEDGTVRVQAVPDTVEHQEIRDILSAMDNLGIPPVLANTSLNGPNQPIINRVGEALHFCASTDIDLLLTDRGIYEVAGIDSVVSLKSDCAIVLSSDNRSSSMLHYNGDFMVIPTDLVLSFFTNTAVPAPSIPFEVFSELKRLDCIVTK